MYQFSPTTIKIIESKKNKERSRLQKVQRFPKKEYKKQRGAEDCDVKFECDNPSDWPLCTEAVWLSSLLATEKCGDAGAWAYVTSSTGPPSSSIYHSLFLSLSFLFVCARMTGQALRGRLWSSVCCGQPTCPWWHCLFVTSLHKINSNTYNLKFQSKHIQWKI